MSGIPEDILRAANKLGTDLRHHIAHSDIELIKNDVGFDLIIAKAIHADRQLDQWQDISTAPTDGSTILAYFPLKDAGKDWCRVMPVYYSKTMHPRPWIFAGRAASSYGEGPTHWQPLPLAPKGGE